MIDGNDDDDDDDMADSGGCSESSFALNPCGNGFSGAVDADDDDAAAVDPMPAAVTVGAFIAVAIATPAAASVARLMAAVATIVPCRSSTYRLFSFCEIICALESIAVNTITYNLFAIIFVVAVAVVRCVDIVRLLRLLQSHARRMCMYSMVRRMPPSSVHHPEAARYTRLVHANVFVLVSFRLIYSDSDQFLLLISDRFNNSDLLICVAWYFAFV